MFPLGILSIIQITFLPGFLILKMLRLAHGFLRTVCLAFALSLTFNHFLVVILTLFGVYVSRTLYCVFAAEVVTLLLLYSGRFVDSAATSGKDDLDRLQAFLGSLRETPAGTRVLGMLLLSCAFASILVFLLLGVDLIGSVFTEWDAVVSWNRWAIDWSLNRFPAQTWDYPQLLPSNVSLTYVFMGDSAVWLFAKALVGLFPLAILLMQLDLGLRSRRLGYFLAIPFSAVLIYRLVPTVMLAGSADMPVSFLAFASIYILLVIEYSPSRERQYAWIALGTICCAGTALAKQAGIPVAFVYPILVYFLLRSAVSGRRTLATCLFVAGGLVFLISPWYIYKIFQSWAGEEILMVTGPAHMGRTYWQRVVFGYRLLCRSFGTVEFTAGFSLALLAGLNAPVWRRFLLLLVIPEIAIWFLFNSYDLRNLALMIPLFATAAATGGMDLVVSALGTHLQWLNRIFYRPAYWFVAALAGVIALTGRLQSDSKLREVQNNQQMLIGDGKMNMDLYNYNRAHPVDGPILTDWQYLRFLPPFQSHYVFDHFESLPLLRQKIKQSKGGYLFTRDIDRLHTDVRDFIQARLSDGTFELALRTQGYCLIQIKGKP